jgi:hypothetical protein
MQRLMILMASFLRRRLRKARKEWRMPVIAFEAEPAPLNVDLAHAALVIIDMQRDFLEPGGFGTISSRGERVSWQLMLAEDVSIAESRPFVNSTRPPYAPGCRWPEQSTFRDNAVRRIERYKVRTRTPDMPIGELSGCHDRR